MSKKYNEDSIQVLEGLEPVRKRPGMYIGTTASRGLHHTLFEIVDNSNDEALEGHADEIKVILHKDGSAEVSDNGRGMPVGVHKKKNIPAERVIFTVLHAGGKFSEDSYKYSGGLHGVGASVVNALSEWLTVTVHKDGRKYVDKYKRGIPQIKLNKTKSLPSTKSKEKASGTSIRFKPDDTIFDTIEFKADTIKKRLHELAYLNPKLTLFFIDENTEEEIAFHEENGLIGLVKEINDGDSPLIKDVISISGESDNIHLDLAFQYTKNQTEQIVSFTNSINNVEGGTHVSGFKGAFTRLMNQYARELKYLKTKDDNFKGKDIRSGITLVISVFHPDPQFEGQTKTKLGNSDARGAISDIVAFELQQYFDRNVDVLEKILKNTQKAYKSRKVDEKKKDAIFNKKKERFETNKKLANCKSNKPEESEIYIVEGDSAGGSAKQGRDRDFQAILPLRGKGLNVERQSMSRILGNTEITTMIEAFGCNIQDDVNLDDLKYHKIIIMTDADIDGAHIKTLLLTFFYRLIPRLIFEGYIYIAMPPLYKVENKGKIEYLYDDKALLKYKNNHKGEIFEIQRYKGLGEMNANRLWETTMNPKTRKLKKVTIEDAVEAEETTVTLMGKHVKPRRDFIMKEANSATIDI